MVQCICMRGPELVLQLLMLGSGLLFNLLMCFKHKWTYHKRTKTWKIEWHVSFKHLMLFTLACAKHVHGTVQPPMHDAKDQAMPEFVHSVWPMDRCSALDTHAVVFFARSLSLSLFLSLSLSHLTGWERQETLTQRIIRITA